MLKRKTVLITDKFSKVSLQTLKQQDFLFVRQTASPDLSKENLDDVNGLIIRSRTRVDEKVFSRAKNLQVLITCTSGFDHIDLRAAAKWGVTVMFTPKANIESAAQLTWSLLLATATRIQEGRKLLESGQWNREDIVGTELGGKVFGVVGLGRIGSRVAEIAQAFNMHVVAFDPFIEDAEFKSLRVEKLGFAELLSRVDFLSFHVPLTEDTQNMMKPSDFAKLRGVILINASRGQVLDEGALLDALKQGQVAAAGLDVFMKEPLSVNSELLQHPRLVLSPHIGANTLEAFEKASDMATEKLLRFFVEGTTSDTLPPKAAWYTAQN
jgi:D-3-phosphoglycerate dehydrogenase